MILFDLDGTLVDTAPDLGYALNLQRQRHGLPMLPDEVIRPYASHGSKGLLEIGFGLKPEDQSFNSMRIEYLSLYDDVLTRAPQLFDGMIELLDEIARSGERWGIVTNKPARFTEPLLKSMNLYDKAACVVSGDDAIKPKPAPDTLLLACQIASVEPSSCVYVGDAERDIVAGRAAGMRTVVALYGYLSEQDQPQRWGADVMINHPRELSILI